MHLCKNSLNYILIYGAVIVYFTVFRQKPIFCPPSSKVLTLKRGKMMKMFDLTAPF